MRKSQIKGKLFWFDRGKCNDGGSIHGYVLDYNDDWTLIQYVDHDISFDGYTIFRNSTVKRYGKLDDANYMIHRALRKMGYIPKVPQSIDLMDLNSILLTTNALFPLIVIHRELLKKGVCYVGGVSQVTSKTMILETINPDANYGGPYRIRSQDITRIDFGGHYETALWAVASKKTKNSILKACRR